MLLKVSNLKKYFPVKKGIFSSKNSSVKAVDDVSFTVEKNEILGLVGESGCGKTTTGRLILRLIEPTSGSIIFKDKDLLQLSSKSLKEVRRDIQIIFQDPLSSLNPRMTVKEIVSEPFIIHKICKGRKLDKKIESLLNDVGLSYNSLNRYPHEFSGGQRQRIGIARAIALNPELIIADEPVSALDVSIQAQIINLLKDLKDEYKMSYIFIAHNISVVKHISDRIAVMYLGKIVEEGPSDFICNSPLHPYTKALIASVLKPVIRKDKKIPHLKGDIPSPSSPPSGCAFHTRCPIAKKECSNNVPEFIEKNNRKVRCPYV